MQATLIKYRVEEDGIAYILLDAPEKRNALSDVLLDQLLAAFEVAKSDDSVRVVVLSSTHPRIFSSGGDLKAFASDIPVIVKYQGLDRYPRIFNIMRGLGKPVIGAANGDVIAGGFGLMLACDLVIAKESIHFSCPEINVGVFPFMVSALMMRSVGRLNANRLMMLGEAISACEAHNLGIATWVVSDDAFDAEVLDLARRLASKSPLLMRLGKDAIAATADLGFGEALAALQAQLALAISTEDVIEGVAAFRERRAPQWKFR